MKTLKNDYAPEVWGLFVVMAEVIVFVLGLKSDF
jgi:hypothetical protein